MSKTVRKILPDDMWNIGKIESWFSDMAKKGLNLKSIGRIFVSFEKCEPSKTKYRMDVINEGPSQEQLGIYKEYGWDFVTKTGMFYVFSSPEDSHSPELHTDPIEQSFTLDYLNKLNKKNLIIISISVLLIVGIICSIYLFQDEPFLYIADGFIVQQMLLIIVEMYVLYTVFRNYFAIQKMKNSLLEGTPINHTENWKKGRLLSFIVNAAIITVSILTIIIPVKQALKSNEYTLSETKDNLPIIRLSDIEENPSLQREVSYNEEGVDRLNRVLYEWSLLAPIQYSIDECGIVNGEMWYDNSGEYSPSIHIQFYKLTFDSMADGLIKDLIHREIYDPRFKSKKISSTEFDQLHIAVDDVTKYIFACWDNNVIFVRYHGNKDIDHLLNLLSEIVVE